MSKSGRIIDPEWHNIFRDQGGYEDELEDALARIPIFGLLSARELEMLSRIVHIRTFTVGEVIIRRGVEQSGLYLIRTGAANIVQRTKEGNDEIVATLYPPDLLGEFALLDSTPRSSMGSAAETSELIGFFKPDLIHILETKPDLGCKILLRLAEEMSRSLNKDYSRLREAGFHFITGDGEEAGVGPTIV